MNSLRISRGQDAQALVTFIFEGEPVAAFPGETIGAALWAAGKKMLRHSPNAGAPRGMFCAMGSCQECMVLVDGIVRTACNTAIAPGLQVRAVARPEVKP